MSFVTNRLEVPMTVVGVVAAGAAVVDVDADGDVVPLVELPVEGVEHAATPRAPTAVTAPSLRHPIDELPSTIHVGGAEAERKCRHAYRQADQDQCPQQ